MKDYIIKKHKGMLAITASAIAVTVIGLSTFNMNDSKEESNKMNVTVPSAGIASVFGNVEPVNNIQEDNILDFSGGIAPLIKNYAVEDKGASIKGVERALSALPEMKFEKKLNETVENAILKGNTKEDNATSGNESQNVAEEENTDKKNENKKTEGKETADKKTEEKNEKSQAATQETANAEDAKSVVEGYTVLGVANVTNYLNVRTEATTDSDLVGKLPMNAGCEILETLDGWYRIKSGEVEGYVSAEFLLTGKEANERALKSLRTVAKVNADQLMVRAQATTESEILTRIAEGEEVEVLGVVDGWVSVALNGIAGFVCDDYVDVYQSLPKGVTMKELSYGDGVNSTAVDLIEYAKQFLGNPYVWGGTSLTNGADCSGFTMRVFEHFGYGLSRTSREQAHNGRNVSLSEIQPGDLLFYKHGDTIGHVAIYIGDGQIIHASTERTGIIIGNAYSMNPCSATRIIGE